MMTVKLMAMATLMSTFITESMCLISIIMRLLYSFVVFRIGNIYVEVFVQLSWATVPSSLGQPQYQLVTNLQLYPPKVRTNNTEMLPNRAAFLLTAYCVVFWILRARTLKELLKYL